LKTLPKLTCNYTLSSETKWSTRPRSPDDTTVALVILQAPAEGVRQDGTSFDLVRRGFDPLDGSNDIPALARLPALAKMFPDPVEALSMRGLARAATLLGDDELARRDRFSEMR
jgi:hypothetical protein